MMKTTKKPVIDLAQSKLFLFAVGLFVRSAQEIRKSVRLSVRWPYRHISAVIATALIISTMAIAELSCNGSIPYLVGLLLILVNTTALLLNASLQKKAGDT